VLVRVDVGEERTDGARGATVVRVEAAVP
jgi:hypothetical protein